MENKIYNIILIILMMTQTISCQEKAAKTNENHFLIKGKEIFYNDSKIALGMPVEDFIKIVNSEHRIANYYIKGKIAKVWTWKDGGEAFTNDDGKIVYSHNDKNLNNGPLDKDFDSIDEIVKIVGKYDSFTEEKLEGGLASSFYVFDKLGFNVAIDETNNTVSQINIYPLPYNKIYKEVKVRDIMKGIGGADDPLIQYVDADNKWKADNYKVMLERQPKTAFKGRFTYNDNTADFSLFDTKDWNKVVKDLKITGSDYNPPGDSKGWSRQIRADYEQCMVDIIRFTNKDPYAFYDTPSAKDVGEIDFVKSIEIWGSVGDDVK